MCHITVTLKILWTAFLFRKKKKKQQHHSPADLASALTHPLCRSALEVDEVIFGFSIATRMDLQVCLAQVFRLTTLSFH